MPDFTSYPRKDNTFYIYVLIDPRTDQIRYVGQCVNPKERYADHRENQKGTCRRANWLNLLRSLNLKPLMEVIEECDESNWSEREIYWIAEHKKRDYDLVNTTIGGEGVLGLKHTEETKQKLSVLSKQQKRSKETTQKCADGHRGLKYIRHVENNNVSQEHRNAAGQRAKGNTYALGYKHTEEAKDRIGKAQRGQKSRRAKLTDEQAREIKYSTLSGVELAKIYNVSVSCISLIKRGKNWGWL